jgi:hypothetical protein
VVWCGQVRVVLWCGGPSTRSVQRWCTLPALAPVEISGVNCQQSADIFSGHSHHRSGSPHCELDHLKLVSSPQLGGAVRRQSQATQNSLAPSLSHVSQALPKIRTISGSSLVQLASKTPVHRAIQHTCLRAASLTPCSSGIIVSMTSTGLSQPADPGDIFLCTSHFHFGLIFIINAAFCQTPSTHQLDYLPSRTPRNA